MAIELIMSEDRPRRPQRRRRRVLRRPLNMGAYAGGVANASLMAQIANVPGRLAALEAIQKANPRMTMEQALAFAKRMHGKRLAGASGIPGQLRGSGVPGVPTSHPTTEQQKRVAAAKTIAKKTKGTPETRVRRTIYGLVYLFTSGQPEKLSLEAKRFVKNLIVNATNLVKANKWPAISVREIEALWYAVTKI